jgi:cytidylate kinase
MSILTVSRLFGTGCRAVITEIVNSMSYTLVDKKLLLENIRESGVKWETWAQELDESAPSFWERYDRSFKGFGALLQSALYRHAVRDNVVLKGRGSNFLMKGVPHAYRIRFIASLENRIERVAKRESIDWETAELLVRKSDEGKKKFVRALYGKKLAKEKHYDEVFNTELQSVDEMVDTITRTLKARSKLKTPEAQKILSIRAAAARIKAALITDPALYIPVLELDHTDTEIVLRGIVRSSEQLERITEAAKEKAGEWPLKVELRYRV